MGLILKLLTSKLTGPIAIGACAFLLVLLISSKMETGFYKGQTKQLTAAVAAKQRDFDTCKANTVTLEGALDRQSAAVKALAAESDRLTAEATKAAGEARKARAAADRSATALLNYKAVGANQCERTADAIRRAREDVR